MQQLCIQRFIMYAVTEVTNEQYKEPTDSRLFEVWESGLAKPPSVAIRSLHNVVNRYLRVTRPEAAEGISNGNVDVIVYLARHDNEDIFPQDIEQRFGVTRSTSCRVLGLMEQKGLIAREPVKRDARLKKIVLTDKSRHIAEVLRDNAKNMERILLEGLEDDQIRQFMHVLDVMQTNLVKTGLIGDESRYPSLEIQEQDASRSQVPQESQVPQKTCDDYASNNRDARDEYVSHVLRISQEMAIARNRK